MPLSYNAPTNKLDTPREDHRNPQDLHQGTCAPRSSEESGRENTNRRGQVSSLTTIIVGTLIVLSTILCYQTFLNKYESGLREAVALHLQKTFPEASVFVGRVSPNGSHQVIVNDLRLAIKNSNPKQKILAAERVTFSGNLDLTAWLQGGIRIDEIHLHGLQVDVWALENGKWSIDRIIPISKPNQVPPAIFLHAASVRLRQSGNDDPNMLALHNLQGTIRPQKIAPTTAEHILKPEYRFHAQCTAQSSGRLKRITLDALTNPRRGTLQAKGTVEGLQFAPELISQLPPQIAKYMEQFKGLECTASSSYAVAIDPRNGPRFKLRGYLHSGRLQDPRLPYPLEQIQSQFYCENNLLQLRSLKTQGGKDTSTQLTLNSNIYGFGLDSPMVIQAQIKMLDLDQRLYRSLPEKMQLLWDRLQPRGLVSGNVQLSFDGQKWEPTASIQCEDVSIRPWLFPYPLENLKGQVRFQNGTISSEKLVGTAGGQPIEGNFSLSKQDTEWYGMLEASSQGEVAIDELLIAALTGRDKPTSTAETFVRSLHPSGSIELVNAKFERALGEPKWHRYLDANIYGGTLKYDRFPYPVYDVRGRLVSRDANWTLDHFEGKNDSGYIQCSGTWQSESATSYLPFKLEFQGSTLQLEEELRRALPLDAQQAWQELQPMGSVDEVFARIERKPNSDTIRSRVEIKEDSTANAVTGSSLRLRPQSFPYWLNDVACKLALEDGVLDIEYASATNGATRMALEGVCQRSEDGRWQADVNWRPTTRIKVDRLFLQALPESIRKSLVKLDFQGPLSVLGKSRIRFPSTELPRTSTSWDCQLDIDNGRLGDGQIVNAIRGTMRIAGQHDGDRINASGALELDALTFKGIPVTDMRGPFALLGSAGGTRLIFGARVFESLPAPPSNKNRDLRAKALAGEVYLSGRGELGSGKFELDALLRNAELQALLQDVGVSLQDTDARCNAHLRATGVPWNPQTYDGQGVVQLRDANLYQLPFMVRLFRAASVKANDSAFQQADIHFQIHGDHIPLQIVCEGEVLRMRGEGWTNLRRDIHLVLHTYVGRRLPLGQVLQPIIPESRLSTLMRIVVDGSLDNPSMQQSVLPQLEDTLQQLFPDPSELRAAKENPLR